MRPSTVGATISANALGWGAQSGEGAGESVDSEDDNAPISDIDIVFDEEVAPGLGSGYKFLLVLIVLFTLYCAMGIGYKVKRLGTSVGMEAIPHVDFWREFPSLVKDLAGFNEIGIGPDASTVAATTSH